MKKLGIYIFDNPGAEIVKRSRELCLELGAELLNSPGGDLGLAPYYTKYITPPEIAAFKYGVLVFHPSLLPMHQGRDALRWAFELREPYTGVTWFWAAAGFDKGDICEQGVIKIPEGARPGNFYYSYCVPEGLRLLRFALGDISRGEIRRRPQILENGSRDKIFKPVPKQKPAADGAVYKG